MREKIDKNIEPKLLESGFKYYDDWTYGPVSGWATDYHFYSLKLMEHNFGYWLILTCHACGEEYNLNIGSSNSADDIIRIRDLLTRLW